MPDNSDQAASFWDRLSETVAGHFGIPSGEVRNAQCDVVFPTNALERGLQSERSDGWTVRGATTFSDLIGKLDVLRVACAKCGRAGSYSLRSLLWQASTNCKRCRFVRSLSRSSHCHDVPPF
jgi:hypothetical protein